MVEREFPAFSVLMSVYKDEKPAFLDEALNSIENQTVIPDEIVVVEDGKLTAELEKVLLDHQQRFSSIFKIIRKEKNEGLGLALRTGMKSVSTDWVARMDTDDIAVPNRFELQLKEIVNDSSLVVVGGQIDEFSNAITNVVGKRNVPITKKEIIEFIKWRNPFNHPTVMFKKNAIMEVGGYRNEAKLEDYSLWTRTVIKGYNVKNIPEVIVHMRVGNGMYGRRGELKNLKEIVKLKKQLQEHGLISKKEEIIGTSLLVVNTLLPMYVRKWIYQSLLHRN